MVRTWGGLTLEKGEVREEKETPQAPEGVHTEMPHRPTGQGISTPCKRHCLWSDFVLHHAADAQMRDY